MKLNKSDEVTNEAEFLKRLSYHDGEAKWLRTRGKVYVLPSMTETQGFPFDAKWGYAFSDELDCIDFEQVFGS